MSSEPAQNKENKKVVKQNDETPAQQNFESEGGYQPLSYDAYKFFTKFSPFIEKILINNINKYYFQNNPIDIQELKAFSKMTNEFKLPEELIKELDLRTNYKTKFISIENIK
jgi:hypothetical protein